ncbi:MAG: hypothetical protein GY862_36420, partial [Gammaproteobacteria bacterium]|nr:hypothetical protein [Gammaproteobacteria bacterium]
GDSKAVDALAKALLDASAREDIRGSAAAALGQIEDAAVIHSLAKTLLDTDTPGSVRSTAAIALGKTKHASAIEPLCSIFSNQTGNTYLCKKILIAFKYLRSEKALGVLKPVIESPDYPLGLRVQSLTAYVQISKKTEPWMREAGRTKNDRLRGKVVTVLARYSEDLDDFIWLNHIAYSDRDFACRTEAVRGLFRAGKLNTPLLRYLIAPDYRREDGCLRDTDQGVRGQAGAGIIRRLGTDTPPEPLHLRLVVEMLADARDTHYSVIGAALGPLEDMPPDKAEQALAKLRELVPEQADGRLLKGLEKHAGLLSRRIQQARSLEKLHTNPEHFLTGFRDKARPLLAQSTEKQNIMLQQPEVVIMTAVSSESRAFLSLLKQQGIFLPPSPIPHKERFYWPFDVQQHAGGVVHCVQVQGTIKGAQGAQSLMADILRDLKPKMVIMAGVCGGFDERGVKLNDIIAAQQVFHYERARIKEDGACEEQPQAYRFSAKFLRWLEALTSGFTLDEALAGAKLYIKDYAAGDKVLMSRESALRRRITAMSGDIYGIEMEGHGLLHEAWETASRGQVETAMIKAVSDFCDGDKNTDKEARQQAAANRASQMVLELLRHYANGMRKNI